MTKQSGLDKLQSWIIEIIGTILFLITTVLLIFDLVSKQLTFSIYVYVILYIVSLAFMGYHAIAKLLTRIKK